MSKPVQIFLFNSTTIQLEKTCRTIQDASKILKCNKSLVRGLIKDRKIKQGYYVSDTKEFNLNEDFVTSKDLYKFA